MREVVEGTIVDVVPAETPGTYNVVLETASGERVTWLATEEQLEELVGDKK